MLRRFSLWILLIGLSIAWAGDLLRARQLLEQGQYDAAITVIQEAMRQKQSYSDLQELKVLLDQALFAKAEQENTRSAYLAYLNQRPTGANANLARQRACEGTGLSVEEQRLCAGTQAPPPPQAILSTAPRPHWPDVDHPIKTGAHAPNDVAVIIGNEDYVFLPDVPYAKSDAIAFYQWLIYTHGVSTSQAHLLDGQASRELILQATQDAIHQVPKGGTLWFYFSGHGAASPSNGSRLLLGDDTRSEMAGFEARAIQVEELRTMAETAGIHAIFVLDTCYSGVGRSGETLLAGRRFAVPAWALEQPISALLEWDAAGPDQLSGPLVGAAHGAFSYFVLGALRGWADGVQGEPPDGQITAQEADLYVRQALRSVGIMDQQPVLSAQTPASWILATQATEKGPDLAQLRLGG